MTGETFRVVAVAPSSIESINRAVYRELVKAHGVEVHLVVPNRYPVGDSFKACAPMEGEPFSATLLEPGRLQDRLMRLHRLPQVIRAVRPTHVIVECDPASWLVRDAVRGAITVAADVWVLTNENRHRRFLREGFAAARRLDARRAVGGPIAEGLLRFARKHVHRVFTISADGTRAMEAMGFAGRVHQIPLGFDPALFFPRPAEERVTLRRRLRLTERTLGYFGRLVPEKGLGVLLEALGRLMHRHWQLLVDRFSCYASPFHAQLQKRVEELHLSDRVVYFDAEHADIPLFMGAADIVVLPSFTTPTFKEQYGRVIPEAMACGKVVVGSECGAIPELIGGAGFIVPERDPAALAATLDTLLTAPDEELQRMGRCASLRAHTVLSVTQQATAWAARMSDRARRQA